MYKNNTTIVLTKVTVFLIVLFYEVLKGQVNAMLQHLVKLY